MTTEALGKRTRLGTSDGRPHHGQFARWAIPLTIFLASRAISTFLLLQGAAQQTQLTASNFPFFMSRDFPSHPGYLDLITTWDGQFYQAIAIDGYLMPEMGDPQAAGRELVWLFPPGFPYTVRAGMWLTGADFALAATLLNVAFGAFAMVVLYDLVLRHGSDFLAVAAVATTSFFVSAPLMQTAFSESLAMLLLLLALRDIAHQRFGRSACWALLLAFTRIVTPPLVAVLLVHLWRQHRTGKPLDRRQAVAVAVLAAVCIAGPLLWSAIATWLRPPGKGISRATDLAGGAVTWFGEAFRYWGPGGIVVMVLLALIVLLMPLTPTGRSLGIELSTWLWAYPFFLFAVTGIQPGILRYLLLAPGFLVPLLGPFRRYQVGRWVALVGLVFLLVLAQRWFVNELIVIDSLSQRFGP